MHALLLLIAWPAGARGLAAVPRAGASALLSAWSAARAVVVLRHRHVPDNFTEMAPYVATLLVLALFAQRLRMPAADGQPYRRGQAG